MPRITAGQLYSAFASFILHDREVFIDRFLLQPVLRGNIRKAQHHRQAHGVSDLQIKELPARYARKRRNIAMRYIDDMIKDISLDEMTGGTEMKDTKIRGIIPEI